MVTTRAPARRAAATVAESWPVKKAASQVARSSQGSGSVMRAELGPPMTRIARSAVSPTALTPRVWGPSCTVASTVTPIGAQALGARAAGLVAAEGGVEERLRAELGHLGRADPAAAARLVEGVAQVADLARGRHQPGAVGDPLDVADDRDARAGPGAHRGRISAGAPCSCNAAGSATEPSSRWPFSSRAMIVRPTATAVPLSVWTGSVPDPPRTRARRRRAW